jgi:hypothetical protein
MSKPPGTTVTVTSSASPNNPPSNIGSFFAVGQASKGPVNKPEVISSLSQYINLFGNRDDNSVSQPLYDAIDSFFQEGGQIAHIARAYLAADITTDTATLDLADRDGTPLQTLRVDAQGPGAYGNDITVAVTDGQDANTFVLTFSDGVVTETSPELGSPALAQNWANAYSNLVVVTSLTDADAPPSNNPAVISATPLAGGVDNTSPASSDFEAALATFTLDLGMGQVAIPGNASPAIWEALCNHALSFNRYALCDGENIATAATIAADAAALQAAATDSSFGFMLVAWPVYPGLATSTATPPFPRTIAPSGPVAGAMARLAAAGNNADVAAAGNNGFLTHATGVSQVYSEDDRALLDIAGVGVIRNYKGNVQLYGYTGLAVDPNWSDVGNCRLRMQIVDGTRTIGDGYVFADIDAGGHAATAFGGQLTGDLLLPLYNQGALFGQTPADAFVVNVGPSINTPTTAQARTLLAQISCCMSPTGKFVDIDVTKYPVGIGLPG